MWNSLEGGKNENTYSIHICFKREIWNASKKVFLHFYSAFWSNTFLSVLGYKSESHGFFPPHYAQLSEEVGETSLHKSKEIQHFTCFGSCCSLYSEHIYLDRKRKGPRTKEEMKAEYAGLSPIRARASPFHCCQLLCFSLPFPPSHTWGKSIHLAEAYWLISPPHWFPNNVFCQGSWAEFQIRLVWNLLLCLLQDRWLYTALMNFWLAIILGASSRNHFAFIWYL